MAERTSTSYMPGLDSLRALAAFAVVTLHTHPALDMEPLLPEAAGSLASMGLNILALFAVPFFFCAAGYFMAQAASGPKGLGPAVSGVVRRTLGFLVFWSVIYCLVPALDDLAQYGPTVGVALALEQSAHYIARSPLHFLLNGGSYQLWFLSTLIQAALLVWAFERMGRLRLLAALAIVLYLSGLFGQGYRGLSPFPIPCNTRTGPFFGLLPFVLGYMVQGRGFIGRKHLPLLLMGAGLALILAEIALLNSWNGHRVGHYYLGSAPLGIGVLLFGLSRPVFAAGTVLPRLGRMSLGIYGSHVIFTNWVEEMDLVFQDSLAWQFLYPLLVFALAWLLSEGLSRIPGLDRFCGRGGGPSRPSRGPVPA